MQPLAVSGVKKCDFSAFAMFAETENRFPDSTGAKAAHDEKTEIAERATVAVESLILSVLLYFLGVKLESFVVVTKYDQYVGFFATQNEGEISDGLAFFVSLRRPRTHDALAVVSLRPRVWCLEHANAQ